MGYQYNAPPSTHPYVAKLTVDPADLRYIQDLCDEKPELKFLDYDGSKPDLWRVRVGCASRTVLERLEDEWC